MVTLILGGSGSGKSAFAEDYLLTHSRGCRKYYLATMQVYDEEGRAKVEKHRSMRAGKGFFTVEQPVNIGEAAEKLRGSVGPAKGESPKPAALLECMSNLVANEMFSGGTPGLWDRVADKVVRETESLGRSLEQLVIVTNNVFEDGLEYEETTREYMKALGAVNRRLAALADRVIEVTAGIPLALKGQEG